MGSLAAGTIVLVEFPFSDLSRTKLRPAVVLAHVDRGDYLLCQVTSKPYGDSRAVTINDASLVTGSLRLTSFARPGKLFTANTNLVAAEVAVLTPASLQQLIDAVVILLRTGGR